jgi:hypothetical protein
MSDDYKQNSQVETVKEMVKIQGSDGNWNYDPYMLGLYNGLEFDLYILENRESVFRDNRKFGYQMPNKINFVTPRI